MNKEDYINMAEKVNKYKNLDNQINRIEKIKSNIEFENIGYIKVYGENGNHIDSLFKKDFEGCDFGKVVTTELEESIRILRNELDVI